MKVLVADDTRMMRTLIRRALEGIEINDIVEAEDGAQAIEFFRESMFDIVLTDWNMPNKDGLQVLKEIRELNSTIPVIVITTEGQKERVVDAVAAGVTDYILKPFEREHLQAKIEEYCSDR